MGLRNMITEKEDILSAAKNYLDKMVEESDSEIEAEMDNEINVIESI